MARKWTPDLSGLSADDVAVVERERTKLFDFSLANDFSEAVSDLPILPFSALFAVCANWGSPLIPAAAVTFVYQLTDIAREVCCSACSEQPSLMCRR